MDSLPAKLTSLFTESPATESTWPWSMSLKIMMLRTAPLTMSRIRKSKFNKRPSDVAEVEDVAKVEDVVSPDDFELESAIW